MERIPFRRPRIAFGYLWFVFRVDLTVAADRNPPFHMLRAREMAIRATEPGHLSCSCVYNNVIILFALTAAKPMERRIPIRRPRFAFER